MAKALVVDDNEDNRYLLQSLLAANGYQVTHATNGQEALEQARSSPPEVVISDILMPVMDGFTLCRQWRQDPALASIPFVFYTATYTDPKDEALALALGADRFIVKPAEPDEFMGAIAGVLEAHRRGRLAGSGQEPAAEAPYLREYNETLIRKLERKLEQLEAANRALALKSAAIEASQGGIALADLSACLTYVNPSFARIWKTSPDALVGEPLQDLFTGDVAWTDIAKRLGESGGWAGELFGRIGGGAGPLVRATIEEVRDRQGQLLCLLACCTDITEQQRLREEARRAQRLEALNLFGRSLAHDFANLLTGLFSNLQLAQAGLPAGSPAAEPLAVAMGALGPARELTGRLHSFAKGAPPVRQPANVTEILAESARLSLCNCDVSYRLPAPAELWPVQADRSQLLQVLSNLITNARQAMNDRGSIALGLRNRSIEPDEIGELRPGPYVEVTVADSGPGIPEAAKPRIFDPFFTTRPDGTGLGLPISYTIVRQHGGHIGFESAPGRGATFTILLPADVTVIR